MNKTVIALLLLGLVVAAMAGEAAKDKMEKMRMKKAKIMAKKEKMHMEKMKKTLPAMGEEAKRGKEMRGKDRLVEQYTELRELFDSKRITKDEFEQRARELKQTAMRARSGVESARKEAARKDEGRNKRSTKEARKMKKVSGMKNRAIKSRRDA
ncbi:uncharacterized protein [Amphiura filiformis]|uniref:uncharacterized protein n=1 Tax=Amphiura filiformis TaxID=82378 RepID=UPI003B219AFD